MDLGEGNSKRNLKALRVHALKFFKPAQTHSRASLYSLSRYYVSSLDTVVVLSKISKDQICFGF